MGLYLKFGLYRILVYIGFRLDRFHSFIIHVQWSQQIFIAWNKQLTSYHFYYTNIELNCHAIWLTNYLRQMNILYLLFNKRQKHFVIEIDFSMIFSQTGMRNRFVITKLSYLIFLTRLCINCASYSYFVCNKLYLIFTVFRNIFNLILYKHTHFQLCNIESWNWSSWYFLSEWCNLH